MNTLSRFLIAGLAALVVACGGGGGGDSPAVGTVASITLYPSSPTIATGASLSMTAMARNASGSVIPGASLIWTSRNSAVVAVDAMGQITGISPGSTEISAASGAVRQTASVTVLARPSGDVASVELEPRHAVIAEGETLEFSALARDVDGRPLDGRTIIWSVLDTDVAAVDAGGRLTALRPGLAIVVARIESVTAEAVVRVDPSSSFGLLFDASDAPGFATIRSLDIRDAVATPIAVPLPGMSVSEPAPSPDGQRLAYVARSVNETAIFVADRNGANVRRLTPMAGVFDQPAWSPDGRQIAFRGRLPGADSDIWIIDEDGSNARNLTVDQGATNQSSPAWSPLLTGGEHRIAYSHLIDGLGRLYTMRPDGSIKLPLTHDVAYSDDQPAWSPDGTQLVFQRSGPAVFGDLFLVDVPSGVVRPLTPYTGPIAGIQLHPSWSPDGRMIAFSSQHADDNFQIYTIWADGTRLARRTTGTIDFANPAWFAYEGSVIGR